MNEETSEVGALRLSPPEAIAPVVFVPDFELRTATARAALPRTVSQSELDEINNPKAGADNGGNSDNDGK